MELEVITQLKYLENEDHFEAEHFGSVGWSGRYLKCADYVPCNWC